MQIMASASNDDTLIKLPVVIVHGGAGKFSDDSIPAALSGVQKAAITAYKSLISCSTGTATALDGVETGIRILESDETFNAGRGSYLTREGTIEMDASIMNAATKKKKIELGGVGAISNVEHAISVARKVLHDNKHVLYAGEGANAYARTKTNIPIINVNEELITDRCKQKLDKIQRLNDTVGAIVIDTLGNIAGGSSTGGMNNKEIGRVGDSPLSGCGVYCLNDIAGITSTGKGESISKVVLCKHIMDLFTLKYNQQHLDLAVHEGLQFLNEFTGHEGGEAGIVAVDSKGNWVADFNSKHMAWACVDHKGFIHGGIEKNQVEQLGHINDFEQ